MKSTLHARPSRKTATYEIQIPRKFLGQLIEKAAKMLKGDPEELLDIKYFREGHQPPKGGAPWKGQVSIMRRKRKAA
jgi:hypothetical protein